MGIPSKSPEHFVEAQVMEVWKPWVSGKLMQSGCIFCSGEPKTWAICLKMWGEKVLTNKNLPKKTVILKNHLKQNIPQRKHSPQTFKKVFPKNIPQRKIWFHWLGLKKFHLLPRIPIFSPHLPDFLPSARDVGYPPPAKKTLFFQNGSCFLLWLCFFQVWCFFLPSFWSGNLWKFQSPSDFSTNHLTLEDFWKKTSPLRIDIIPIIPLVLGPATWLPWSPIPPPTLAAKGRSGACSWRHAKTWQAVRNRNGKQRQAGPTLRTKLDDPRESNQPASPHTGWRIWIGPLQGTIT